MEKEGHADGCGQRVEKVDRGGDAGGDVLVGDDQAEGGEGPEDAEQADDAAVASSDAQLPSGEEGSEAQGEGGHAPAVGKHLERGEAAADQQQGEERGKPEG